VIAFFLIEALLSDYGAGATGLRRLRRLSAKAGTWEQRFPAAQFRKSAAGEANTQKRWGRRKRISSRDPFWLPDDL